MYYYATKEQALDAAIKEGMAPQHIMAVQNPDGRWHATYSQQWFADNMGGEEERRTDLTEVPDKKFIGCHAAPTLADAQQIAPWAAEIVEVDGGWFAFRLQSDADRHNAQM